MKKFYTLLTLCLAFLGIATATAQNAPELSNEKAYTVKNARSAWATSAERLNSITKLSLSENAADANQQFAFLTNDEGETYYLYSVGQQKFINNDGTLSATADYPVYFKKGNAEGTFVAYFDGSHHINIDTGGTVLIDGWSAADAGNSNVYTAVADFDPTEALKALPAPVVPEFPCIKSLSELSNNKLYTVVQKNHSKGATSWAIAAGGDAFVSSKQVEGAVVGQADDTKQQFAFLTYEEQIYLYHPAEQKFVNKDATLSATPVDAITLLDGAFKNTFMVKFDDAHYVNVNGEQNMGIDNWSAADGGNSCTISAVTDFDPTEVLKLFVVPTTVENAGGVNGQIYTTTSTLEITFSAPIAQVNTVAFQALFGEFPPMVEGTDYSFNENVLTINVPTQYLENAANVPAEYRVLILALNVVDADGKVVTYSNSTSYPQEAAEQMGMTFLQYTVIPAIKVASVSPECGMLEEGMPTSVKLTFTGDIKSLEFGQLRTNATGRMGYTFAEGDYTISGKELTLNLPESLVVGQSNMNITLSVVDANDMYVTYASNPDYATEGYITLEYTAPIKADLFAMESATPAAGATVEKLDVVNVTFGNPNYAPMFPGQSQSVGGFDTTKEVVVLNAAGDVVTKASMEVVQQDGWNTNEVKFTLDTPISERGSYTLVIPAGTVYNEMYYEYAEDFGASNGALYNPEVRLDYTVGTAITSFYPELGAIPATTETLTFTFSKEIQAVPMVLLQSTMGELPPLAENMDYFFWGNELSINLPLEYTLKMQDLTVIMSVIDIEGQPVTFSNHSNPGYSQPGMIFVEYALTPVDPEIVEINPVPGEMEATNKSIYMSFNTSIAEVEMIEVKDSKGWTAEMVLDENYYVWDKDLSIILPLETAKKEDLSVVLKVKDIQGKYATYGEEEGMINLAYTLVPVTPTVEDCGAVNQTITTATSSIDVMFTTPIAKVSNLAIQSMFGEFPPMVEGTDYSFYDNILTVNIPTQYLENAALVPEEYQYILLGMAVEDVQGKMVVYSNSTMMPQEAAEQRGMTFLQYTVKPVTKVTNVDPACGFYEVLPSKVTLTFDNEISAVEYGMIQTQLTGFRGYMMTEDDYVIDGNKLTINVPEAFLVDQSHMQIRMNVVDVKGMYVTYAFDPDYGYEDAIILEYTAPVKADLYKMVSSDPAEGAVEKLDVINVAFEDAYGSLAGGFDPSKEVVVLNAAGEVVAKAAMEVVFEAADEYGWAPPTNVVKFTLDTPVTETGIYTFVIPAGTVYNEMFYPESEDFGVEWGALYNPEISITYTIGDVTGINGVTVNGKSEIYSIDGRKVTNPTKGIYVVNGKKVVVK